MQDPRSEEFEGDEHWFLESVIDFGLDQSRVEGGTDQCQAVIMTMNESNPESAALIPTFDMFCPR